MLHLIHPALVHFSVAFVVLGGLSEVVGHVAHRNAWARWGASLTLVGLISLVLTIASGYLASNTLIVPDEGRALLGDHERNGWLLLALLFATQFWKAWCGGRVPEGRSNLYALLMLATVLLALYSAFLGGKMVFVQGVGVL